MSSSATSLGHRPSVSAQGDAFFNSVINNNVFGEEKPKKEYVEGSLRLYDTINVNTDVMCTKFNGDGSLVAIGHADGTIAIHDSDSGQCLYSMAVDNAELKQVLPVTSVHFSPSTDNQHLLTATYASGHIRFWHYPSGKCLSSVREERQTLALAFNSSQDKLVTVGSDPMIYVYDVATRQIINTLEATDSPDKMDGHRARVFTVRFHPSYPNVFLTGGWDDTVQFWNDNQKHSIKKIYGPHICGDGLDIEPQKNHVVTGSWRREDVLEIWDYNSCERVKMVPQDPRGGSLLYCTQWVGKDYILCGGCTFNMARLIDCSTLNTVGMLAGLQQGVYCIDYDRDGSKSRMAVGAGKKLYLLKLLTVAK